MRIEHCDGWGAERSPHAVGLDLVFTDEVGRELQPDRVSHILQERAKASKLPRITLHGLRHTPARIQLIELGTPVYVVSKRLGHADAAITLNAYSHAS